MGTTISGRAFSSLAGLLSLVFIARLLTGVEQGFYYTFNSLLALQVFFELGLSMVILHAASHEISELTLSEMGSYVGPQRPLDRLACLLQLSSRIYLFVAGLLVITVIPAGFCFFSAKAGNQVVQWQLPWVLVVVFTALSMVAAALLTFLEGCGQVEGVAKIRLIQNICANGVLWVMLLFHCKLFATVGYAFATAAVPASLALKDHAVKLRDLLARAKVRKTLNWKEEIWPFQWKMAISWLSGYFIFQLFVPILFQYRSPVEAGQMGMSLAILSGISSLCFSWVQTKVPKFGSLIAMRKWSELDALFWASTKRVVGIAAGLGFVFWLVVLAAYNLGFGIAQRVIAPLPMLLLVLATIASTYVFSIASYLRSHKQEPFLYTSVAMAAATALLAFLLGRAYGSLGVCLAYLFTSCVISLGLGELIFRQKRREWHSIGDPA